VGLRSLKSRSQRRDAARFSEADRQAPAWLLPSRGQTVLEVVRARPPGASPMVSFEAGFFDPKQSRHEDAEASAPQRRRS